MRKSGVILGALCLATPPCPPLSAQIVDEIRVTATRLSDPEARRVYGESVLLADDFAKAPTVHVDEILGQIPGLSLFRRASSLLANPTTQGVSLRGIGPNGAGRALVLLDGVPLNDPFGGWVFWSALDPQRIAQASVVRGSGAGPYGNQALTGVIRLESKMPADFTLDGMAEIGTRGTRLLSLGIGDRHDKMSYALSGHYRKSDGFILRDKQSRGAVDVPAKSDVARISGVVETALSDSVTLSGKVGWFEENRSNGTILTGNDTEVLDGSLRLVRDAGPSDLGYELTAFITERDFSSRFSAVDAGRASESPVLDQFNVPSRGAGLLAVLRVPLADGQSLDLGGDVRRLEGETNEAFRNLGDGFTRVRRAGGDQWLAGLYADYAGTVFDRLDLSGGIRLDYWRTFNGVLTESDLADGTLVRDDAILDRDGLLLNGRLGARYRLTDALSARISGYSGFRLPSLNEFFRPFRVGNDITEANPNLEPERLYGFDLGVQFQPLNSISLGATYFRNWLHDGVGNITVALGPGIFPPTGFVPAGGSLRQRQNIDRITADGIEMEGRVAVGGQLSMVLRYLYVNARITDAGEIADLAGKRVAQSPKHSLTMGADWTPTPKWSINFDGRYLGAQFDDDGNSRFLSSAFTLDMAIRYRLSADVQMFLAAENIFGETVESQTTGDGDILRAQPQLFSLGVELSL